MNRKANGEGGGGGGGRDRIVIATESRSRPYPNNLVGVIVLLIFALLGREEVDIHPMGKVDTCLEE